MASDIFLKIDTIEGESTDKFHKGEIDILEWHWGVSNSAHASGGGGGAAGKSVPEDFSFSHAIDRASPRLMLACCLGEHIGSAVLSVRKSGGEQPQDYLKIKLSDCLISSVAPFFKYDDAPFFKYDDDVPHESFSLNFVKIDFTEVPQSPTGASGVPIETFFDFKLNRGGIIQGGGGT